MSEDCEKILVPTRVGACLNLKCEELYRSELCRGGGTLVLLDISCASTTILEKLLASCSSSHTTTVVVKMRVPAPLAVLSPLLNNPLEELVNNKHAVGYYTAGRDSGGVETYVEVPFNSTLFLYLLLNTMPKPLACFALRVLRFVKFSLVGLTGFFVNLAVLYAANYVLSLILAGVLVKTLASMISFEVSLTWNFTLHELWTFRDLKLSRSPLSVLSRWLRFHIGSLGSFAAQVVSVTLLSGYAGLPLYASLLIGVTAGVVVNYVLSRITTWR